MRTSFGLALAVTLALVPSALSQNSPAAGSPRAKIEFEDGQIRLLHARYAAYEKIPMHSHPARVVVCITEMHVLTTLANGETQELTCKPGESRWSEPVTH